jgi:hypothetical protein
LRDTVLSLIELGGLEPKLAAPNKL